MDITGEHRIAASREAVWGALNDPAVLARCIPGCKELDRVSPEELSARVSLKVGPVSATFAGTVRFEDVRPPEGYVLVGQGNGGVAGFAKGRAVVALREDGPNVILTYEARAEIGGKLAGLGGRLIQATTRKLADQFFGKLAIELGVTDTPEPATTDVM